MNQKLKNQLPLILVFLLACFTYMWALWNETTNLYYSSGVYSMGQNLHAFFYNSIDSVGFISIDKPPLGLWIQVLFTKIFGFSNFAILLPEALAGVFSVFALYIIIEKRFSRTAATASSFVLAFTPILSAVCRNNTIDGILIFMLVLASWQAIVAAEKSSLKHLILASVFIALGFNVKSLQAYMIVPAVYLTYLVFSNEKIFKKLIACSVSVTFLIAISFSWIMIVDLTPAQSRPYVGSSGTNSELNLTLGNNGLGRLIGGDYKKANTKNNSESDNKQINRQTPQQDNPQTLPQNKQQAPPQNKDANTNTGGKNNPKPGGKSDRLPPNAAPPQFNANTPGRKGNQNPTQNISNGKGNGGESGATSILRLYISNNAGQIAWFLLPALLTSLIFILQLIKKQLKSDKKHVSLFYFSMCFLPMLFYFTFSSGVVHRYYLAMLAFPIAALVGIGLSFVEENKKISRIMMSGVFLITAIVQLYIQSLYTGWLTWLLPLCALLFFAVFLVLVASIKFNIKKQILTFLLSVLLILPGVWSLTPIIYGNNAQLPIAGPELVNQGDAFDKHPDLSKLISYLNENRDDATYLAAVPSAMSLGAELILQSGEPVMVLGGFNGGDNPVTVDEFKQLIADGTVKYAILSSDGAGKESKQSPVLDWIAENCIKINKSFEGVELYQLEYKE